MSSVNGGVSPVKLTGFTLHTRYWHTRVCGIANQARLCRLPLICFRHVRRAVHDSRSPHACCSVAKTYIRKAATQQHIDITC